MKFSLSWLKSHLDTAADVDTIAKALTAVGLEVEGVTNPADHLSGFNTALIVEAHRHPDADKLQVCLVDTGTAKLQVVCGAPNARAGLVTVFGREGAVVPRNGMVLKKTSIRGVESNGMCCSGYELNLTEDHEGILELPDATRPGIPVAEILGVNDPVFEIAITPNRADCLGVRGVARDLAAFGLGTLIERTVEPVAGGFASHIAVKLALDEAHAACPLFLGRLIKGVRNGDSPDWLKQRLTSIGLRPISALVDITNFLTFDVNRPLHVFDAAKVTGDLVVRMSRTGESLEALNGKTYALDDAMTVIADDSGVLSLGAVMGGASTGVTAETVDVFIEAALFDPLRTAATGRRLGLNSDARYRFERGVDPQAVFEGMEAATRLIQEICGGQASHLVVAGAVPADPRRIHLRSDRPATLGGVDVPVGEQRRILESLGFVATEEPGGWSVVPPSWRGDIEGEADLIEEILRIHGYHTIPALPPLRGSALPSLAVTPTQARAAQLRRYLASRGLSEAVTWAFLPKAQAELFGGGAAELTLANPISSDLDQMRPTPLPNLIAAAVRNRARGIDDVALVEIGPGYLGETPDQQKSMAVGLRVGQAAERSWRVAGRPVDAFDAKADILGALQSLGLSPDGFQVVREAPDWYHPGRSAALKLGPKVVVGYFGELHPSIAAAFDLDAPAVAFELLLDAVPLPKAKAGRTRSKLVLSPFQKVERDFAFLIGVDIAVDTALKAARGIDKKLIDSVTLFDLYQGKGLPEGMKSIGLSITLQPSEATLTDAEIETVSGKVVAAVEQATGGKLRG